MSAHVVAAILTLGLPGAALAQNATWNGPGNDFNTDANWSSGQVPTGTGTFDGAAPTTVLVTAPTTLQSLRFAGTTSYIFDICGCGLTLTGTGIENNTGVQQTFNLTAGGTLNFLNNSTVTNSVPGGSVVINNTLGGVTLFGDFNGGGSDTASAGSATIVNETGGGTGFFGRTTGGTANITNQNGGFLQFTEQSQAGGATITNDNGGATFFLDQTSAGISTITNLAGGQTVFGDPSGLTGPHFATAGNATITTQSGGALEFYSFTTAGNATIFSSGNVNFFDNSTGGTARFVANPGGTIDFSGTLGPLNNGVLTAGSIEGGGTFIIGNNNLIVGGNNLSTEITGTVDVCNCGILTKVGSGTLTFAAASNLTLFNGSLVIDAGKVVMDGDLSAALGATVNAGATLAGGALAPSALPATWINGGTLSPGDSGAIGAMVVVGGLQNPATGAPGGLIFSNTGTFAVDVLPTGAPGLAPGNFADRVLVVPNLGPGSAILAGTLRATGLGGPGYTIGARYMVLGAQDGFGTSRFNSLFVAGDFGSTRPVIVYDNNDTVYLDLIQGSVSGQLTPGATRNQISVASGLDAALLGGANFAAFTHLYNLTGDAFLKALDQLSGEAATGFQQAAYQSMNSFINTMLNPWSGARGGFGPAMPFADADADVDDVSEYAPRRKVARQAKKAMATAMPVKAVATHEPRYAVWGAAYGGSNSIDGDPVVVGSHKTNVSAYGFATGVDMRVTRDALIGFALAGGRSSWGLSDGLGGGAADNFQAGIYGSMRFGPAYLSAAMAYGAHWVETKRNVVSPGWAQLSGDYDAHSFGGRLEAGYRLAPAWGFGVTPYAALQAQAVRAPSYLETTKSGAGAFGLQYNRVSDSNVRTELGTWVERSMLYNSATVTLRGRLAWAHDSGTDRAINAAFPVLPGSGFRVDGASPADNLALLSAAAEFKYLNGVSLLARIDSELSDRSRAFSGTGTFRYVW